MATWTQAEAIDLCRKVEPLLQPFGCHVALTGGLLYKDGPRKDCDLIIYRQGLDFGKERGSFEDEVDRQRLLVALEEAGIRVIVEYIRVVKCQLSERTEDLKMLDLIFPEMDGEYVPDEKGTALLDDPDLAMEEARERKHLETVFASN